MQVNKVNSIMSTSFGKIYVNLDSEQKDELYMHTACGIGEAPVKNFLEKYRLANLSDRFDIKFDQNGAEVLDKKTSKETPFSVQIYSDYPNALYHTLNAALNYVLVKENRTFESGNTK